MRPRRRGFRTYERVVLVFAAALVASMASAATAGATAGVSLDGGTLVVTSAPATGSDGNHTMIVEPFVPTSPTGVRVRQVFAGSATLFSSAANCRTNLVFNDVVCDGAFDRGTVTLGDGDDIVFLVEPPPGAATCVEGPPRGGTFTVALGPGTDRVDVVESTECPGGTSAQGGLLPRVVADGDAGTDDLRGGPLDDVLNAGPGDDTVDGGPGDDRISPGTGTDTLAGGDGDDFFCCASSGSATIRGNAGTDTVSYSPTTFPVGVTIADSSDGDGLVGITRDDVTGTVENVITGDGPDAVVGDGDRNVITTQGGGDTLRGGDGRDTLEAGGGNDNVGGGGGNDTLNGGDGGDVLVGQGGVDAFSGGPGDDTLNTRDGARDGVISCGPGNDVAEVDLRDTLTFATLRDCEFLDRTARNDGAPAAVIGRRVRVAADGSAVVVVACPSGARVACRGTVTVRLLARRSRVIGTASYARPLGSRGRVAITLTRVPRAGSRLLLQTRERGVSRLGLRGSTRQMTVLR